MSDTVASRAGGKLQAALALRWFVVAAPGLEEVVRAEVEGLPGATQVRAVEGGVELDGDLGTGMAANLQLRTATRVLLRAGTVKAREFSKLRRLLAGLPWERWVPSSAPLAAVRIQASASRCRLYHTGAVAQTVLAAMNDRLKVSLLQAKGGDEAADDEGAEAPEASAPIRVLARGVNDEWTISVDSSGELLHRRGWRTEAGPAPMRETLAAAVLALAGYDPGRALLDPMCGAGTLALEAAARARGLAPGRGRRFAFQRWPSFDARRWEELRAAADATPGIGAATWAWDRDPAAVETARRNAERAGLSGAIRFATARFATQGAGVEPAEVLVDLRAATDGNPGLVVINPPYGRRLANPGAASRLARSIGRTLAASFSGWRAAVLVPDGRWEKLLGLQAVQRFPLRNGGLRVVLVVGRVG